MAKIIDEVDFADTIKQGIKSKDYSDTALNALDTTRSHDLAMDIIHCGDWDSGNQLTCHSLYCAKKGERNKADNKNTKEAKSCYMRLTNSQTKLMRTVRDRYDDDIIAMRNNLRSVTILFSAFGFDLDGRDNPVFPLVVGKNGKLGGVVMNAKRQAKKQLDKVKNEFPDVKWLGGYSWEIQHLDKLGPKKSVSLDALINLDNHKFATACQKVARTQAQDKWHKYYINFHSHLVVDLNGTSDIDFHDFCHSIWGKKDNKKRPVPDGVMIKKFDTTRSIPDSLDTLAQYPFRNQWEYKWDYDGEPDEQDDNQIAPKDLLEPELLSALISATRSINKHSRLVVNNNWQ